MPDTVSCVYVIQCTEWYTYITWPERSSVCVLCLCVCICVHLQYTTTCNVLVRETVNAPDIPACMAFHQFHKNPNSDETSRQGSTSEELNWLWMRNVQHSLQKQKGSACIFMPLRCVLQITIRAERSYYSVLEHTNSVSQTRVIACCCVLCCLQTIPEWLESRFDNNWYVVHCY